MRRITVRSILMLLVVGTFGFLTACGGSEGSTPVGVPTPPPAGQNVVPIAVNGGPMVRYPERCICQRECLRSRHLHLSDDR